MQTDQWPPSIRREQVEAKELKLGRPAWIRSFAAFLSVFYFVFSVFLVCIFVPALREALNDNPNLRLNLAFLYPFLLKHPFILKVPYLDHFLCLFVDLGPFRFTAFCLVIGSIVGSVRAFCKLAVVANSHGHFVVVSLCFVIASIVPGSFGYYLANLEYPLR
jgi:hypothetical protein